MKRILIDADTGIDDSIAILFALASDRLHVEGITTCFGNVSAAQAADNTLRLLQLSGCGYGVPVAVGAETTLSGERMPAPEGIHGKNGIGDVALPPSPQQPLAMEAADFIVQKAQELEGELTLVTLGPLTNVALALQKDPQLPRRVKRVVSMGGCLTVPGNRTACAEANFYNDAQAADLVLRAGFPLIAVGLDVTQQVRITGDQLAQLQRLCAPAHRGAAAYIRSALSFYFGFYLREEQMLEQCYTHDPLAMLIAEDASLGEYRMLRTRVEHAIPDYRGMVLPEHPTRRYDDQDETSFCVRVDADRALRRLFSAFC